MYADIIVDISAGQLDKTYQYRIPEKFAAQAVIGAPVLIPFGNRQRKGYIVDLSEEPKIEEARIKPLIAVEERGKVIESNMITLAYFIRENFGGTMNAALHTVLPVKKEVRQVEKKKLVLAAERAVAGDALAQAVKKKHVAKERLLRELLAECELPWEVVTEKLAIPQSTIKSLVTAGLVRVESMTQYRNPMAGIVEKDKVQQRIAPPLTKEQQNIVTEIVKDYTEGLRKTYLLRGVTGSGKTEVYLSVIEEVVRQGRQVIMLIPEIALTYQTVLRFYHRFGDRVSILNSRMSQGERYDQSLRAERGEIDIMIGPRSALFTPFPKLGLIILDEEHENSYKSEMPPKYHAREVAVKRAELEGASVLLGSATPSLEAYNKALQGEYRLFTLTGRAVEGARLPQVEIVDLREELKEGNRSIFSRSLREKITERLAKKEQIMLFMNRRGYAGFVSCRSCGHVMKCPHCDISMTEHSNGTLVCHYCGHTIGKPPNCPVCGSKYIAAFGTGTQKIEELVRREFPQARVLRMDADTTRTKDSYEDILSAFSCKEADILIGTQMIVKGHDFPMVTLVGILAADLSLNSNDYRAAERTFELLAQAAGRAGRGERAGEVLIQTYQPEHYSIQAAAKEDYEGFFAQEMAYRRAVAYPPAANILAMLVLSPKEELAEAAAALLAGATEQFVREQEGLEITLIGPVPASLAKANDIYRRMIYVKQEDYNLLVALKNFLEGYILYSENFKNVNVQFDFNPMSGY
ncbi:MAG: primosomal protein N' [Lachnospiraceae bacterium]|nr:primosomal protein N' [Lachnospiraceae bacterium]